MKKALIIEVEEKDSEVTVLTLRSLGTDSVLIKLDTPGAEVSITELKAALEALEKWQYWDDNDYVL